MKKLKKGFTLVEMVIVIAVIGILAAVLIPTFAASITSAKESVALQECNSAYSAYKSDLAESGDTIYNDDEGDTLFVYKVGTTDEMIFVISSGTLTLAEDNAYDLDDYTAVTPDEGGYLEEADSNVTVYVKTSLL